MLPKLLPTASRSPEFLPLCAAVARELHVGEGQIVPLGLHGDGVPFDSQRTRSLELLHLNFPATGSPLRVPVVGVPKEFFVKGKTYQALLELLAWSLRWCAMGQHPPALPDGTPFVDKQAAALAGQPLGCRAALLEVRADWQFLKICFGFPAWNEKAGCCWLCEATPGASIRQTGPDALWRRQRLDGLQALLRMRDRGQEVSPLFGAPGLRPMHFVPDWLHVMDLGVAPTILGHLLYFAIAKAPGANRPSKVQHLHSLLIEYYQRKNPSSRLDTLTYTMIRAPGKLPKLRGKAAEVRGLVPFGRELAERFFALDNDFEGCMIAVARELEAMYLHLDHFEPTALSASSRKVAGLWVCLEAHSEGGLWRFRPKGHLMQELAEFTAPRRGCPRDCWCYRDADFMGRTASASRSRGGANSPATVSLRVLHRFAARFALPAL